MAGIPLPVKIRKSRKCNRCTMRYKVVFNECPHCKDIPDGSKLEEHIQKYHDRLRANGKVGMIFLGVSALLTSVFIVFVLAR